MMDIALAVEKILYGAKYRGSVVANSPERWDVVEWRDSRREKPTWLELEAAWAELQKPPTDTRTPEEKRRDAYVTEADPLFQEAMYYQAEAEGLKASGDYEKAAIAEAKAIDFKKRYAAAKAEIRERFPDEGPERYCLNASGTYHTAACSYASEVGEMVTLEEIAGYPKAKPCSRCGAPALSTA